MFALSSEGGALCGIGCLKLNRKELKKQWRETHTVDSGKENTWLLKCSVMEGWLEVKSNGKQGANPIATFCM